MVMVMMMMRVAVLMMILTPLMVLQAFDIHQVRQQAAQKNVTCIIVFGDSTVDPGNNNHLATTTKSNFPPYGKDFFNGRPTGRFSNGRLATDFVAEALGYTKVIPAFLDPNTKKVDLLHGVSFASAGSGYDDLTANLSKVLPVSKQLEYFLHYKLHLRELVGEKKAEEIIRNAIFVMSMGTNDFLQNYYLEPIRSKEFTMEEYQNYLISRMLQDIKVMHGLGARRLAVAGVPPFGCIPVIRTLKGENTCVDSYNKVAYSFNSKIKEKVAALSASLSMKIAYADVYGVMDTAVNNPKRYGIAETSKGCCGTGTIEFGESCRGLNTCRNPGKYAFWDAVHPTQKLYKIISEEILQSVLENLF